MYSSRLRAVAIANAAVVVAAVLSIGQVQYALNHHASSDSVGLSDGSQNQNLPGTGASPSATGSAGPGTSKSPRPGSPTPTPGVPISSEPGATVGPPPPPVVVTTKVPEFGLLTQGVTPTSVLIGADYDKTGCGGSAALANQFSAAATGDPKKAFPAFVKYINDTGGIHGRRLDITLVDDGGLYCPERHKAAEIELVDQKKVFMDIAGLHEVSDLLAKRHLPFMGGRSSIAEQRKQGYGQFQVFQDADGDFNNWASFGRNYINSATQMPCLIHPDTPDFNGLEPLLVSKMSDHGLKFGDIVRYADDPSTAQQQATTAAARMKNKGCKQVWLVANNAIADVFFTNAAASQNWHPTWTWTARTYLIDQKLGGSLMSQSEWKNSVGLTTRVQKADSPHADNCSNIYKRYYPNDGQDQSAAVVAACAGVLTSAEAMRRAIDVTGVLTGNSLMLGVNAIRGNFFWDAHVPMTFSIPDLNGPFDFTGFDVQTVAQWNNSDGDYRFPEYPRYWKVMGENRSGWIDIRPALRATYTPPKR